MINHLQERRLFKQSQVILCLPDTRGSKLLVLCYSALKNIMTDCRHASNKLAELVPFQCVQDKTGFRKLLPTTAGEFDFLLPSLHVWAMSHWPRRLSGAANSLYILGTAAMWEASGVRWFARSSYVFEQFKRAVLLHTDPSHRRLASDLEALSGSSLQPSWLGKPHLESRRVKCAKEKYRRPRTADRESQQRTTAESVHARLCRGHES